ncbi:MAG: MoaD/ThiS family protein [Acidimicrobiia bacterium]
MAQLRLFASLREIAGTARVEIPGSTVGEVVAAAGEKFGPGFVRGVETSRVWLNGEEASMDDPVSETDEVVVLPPVSGGARPATLQPADLIAFLPVIVLVLVVAANSLGLEVWAAALVATAALWALDLGSTFSSRGRLFAPVAVVVSSVAAVIASHTLGGLGYGLTSALAAAVILGWAVALAAYRPMDVAGPTLLAALLVGLGTASLLLTRSPFAPVDRGVDVFLVSVTVAVALGSLVARIPAMPFLDPMSVTALAAVGAAVGAAAFWELDVVGYLLVGLVVAVTLVAGRGLSSILRRGVVSLTELSPGVLASLDGVVLAAALYYPLLRIVF